ncbi:hypothetical protein GCM10011383_07020 [Hymenobacter cavernae]|uniref:Uncharacterized protein n=1 Tax=Hymenobacter cavernae TaxID=2044852 RepID=A0ABQ1TQJ3_9BACT|nr:hypothetical protein GCM10011383_07020 [Hymenobacter cavernae]
MQLGFQSLVQPVLVQLQQEEPLPAWALVVLQVELLLLEPVAEV